MLTEIADQQAEAVQPRARGVARLTSKVGPRGSVIGDLHQAGSAKLVFPRSGDDSLQAVLVNTAGGITGGDRFDMSFEAVANTSLTLTTQAAERAYGAQANETGQLTTTLKIGAGARLQWLPQETILFDQSRYCRTLRADLAADGQLLFVETLTDIAFNDRVEIYRDGVPLFCDAVTLNGDALAHFARAATGNGARAMASVVYVAPEAPTHLANIRNALPVAAGATLIGRDVLHIRILAPDSFDLRTALIPVLETLSAASLPKAWMI